MSADIPIDDHVSEPLSLHERYKIASKSGLSRNDLCCCGSGKKIKKCCLSSEVHAGFMAHEKEQARLAYEARIDELMSRKKINPKTGNISPAVIMAMAAAMAGQYRRW